jgi:predicted nucleic acid-binding protein
MLDTSVLSQLAPGRGEVSANVIAWLEEREPKSHISVISVLEMERGIAKLIRQGHSAKARAISGWMDALLNRYSRRIVEINSGIARCAGRLEDAAIGNGFSPGLADALIGASAVMHDGIVVSRNVKHFRHLGVECVDPFLAAP